MLHLNTFATEMANNFVVYSNDKENITNFDIVINETKTLQWLLLIFRKTPVYQDCDERSLLYEMKRSGRLY